MYKAIVAGTDGSPTAMIAFGRAVQLAKLTGATVHVVHAHQLTVSHSAVASVGTVDVGSINQDIRSDSARVCADAIAIGARDNVEVVPHSMPGDAADALIAVAEDVDADLIVVGNRGMQGARRFVLGSVPNKVSHHSPCSLLIVDTTRG
jgi:nucleotide-binding universal stress UspA family protein